MGRWWCIWIITSALCPVLSKVKCQVSSYARPCQGQGQGAWQFSMRAIFAQDDPMVINKSESHLKIVNWHKIHPCHVRHVMWKKSQVQVVGWAKIFRFWSCNVTEVKMPFTTFHQIRSLASLKLVPYKNNLDTYRRTGGRSSIHCYIHHMFCLHTGPCTWYRQMSHYQVTMMTSIVIVLPALTRLRVTNITLWVSSITFTSYKITF